MPGEIVLDLGVLGPDGLDSLDEPPRPRARRPGSPRSRLAAGLAAVVVAVVAGGVATVADRRDGTAASRQLAGLGLDRVLDEEYRDVGAAQADVDGACRVGALLRAGSSEASVTRRRAGHAVAVALRVYGGEDAARAAVTVTTKATTTTCTSYTSRIVDGSVHTLEYDADGGQGLDAETASGGGLALVRTVAEVPSGESGCVVLVRRGRTVLAVETVVDAAETAAARPLSSADASGLSVVFDSPACTSALGITGSLALGVPFP